MARIPVLFLMFILVLTACKKYEEGPAFSLLSKRSRLVNTWTVDQYLENGVDKTDAYLTGYTDYSLQVFKNGTYTENWYSLNAPFTESGNWQFENDKEEVVFTPANNPPREYVIIRLRSRQLWLRVKGGTVVKELHLKKK
jgi:hypothetical protein